MEKTKNEQKMEIVISKRTDITPLLGMDYMRLFKLTIARVQLVENNKSENEKVFRKFPDSFENNRTIKDANETYNLNRDSIQRKKKLEQYYYT